jgi:hypothetical protein
MPTESRIALPSPLLQRLIHRRSGLWVPEHGEEFKQKLKCLCLEQSRWRDLQIRAGLEKVLSHKV